MANYRVTDRMIRSGIQLLKDLSKSHFEISLAFWFYYEQENEWWFIIESPKADQTPQKAIQDLQNIYDKTRHPSISDIKVYGPKYLQQSFFLPQELKQSPRPHSYEGDGIYIF